MTREIPGDDELFDIIGKEALVDRAKLIRDAKLADLGIESLDVVSILFEIEERYGVVIEENDIGACETLGELIDQLKARVAAAE